MALKDLVVNIGANTSGFDKGLRSVSSGVKNLTSGLAGLVVGFAGAAISLQGLVSAYKSYASLESNIQRTNDLFGASSKYISYFAENTGKSLGIAESSAYQYAATYGNLFKGITKDSTENTAVTIAMMKASAVTASKTGRTMGDVMERIRSGLLGNTESIEDLGINVGVASLEMTGAFKQIANGRSWEQLNFYEQQQVRTMGILEQVSSKYGNTVTNNTAFSMSVLSGVFSDFQANAGLLLSGVLNPIVRGLTTVVQWASIATRSLAAFLGIKINTNTAAASEAVAAANNDIATSADNAAASTAKQKKSLMGFQELNIASFSDSESSGSSGSGSSGGSTSVFDNIAVPEYVAPAIDTSLAESSISKFVGLFNFEPIKQSWENLKTALSPIGEKLGEGLKWLWDNVLLPFSQWAISDYIPAFLDELAAAAEVVNSVLEALKPLGEWLWNNFLQPIAEWTGGLIISIMEDLASGLRSVSDWIDNNQIVVQTIVAIIAAFAAVWLLVSVAIGIWNIAAGIAAGVTTVLGAAIAFLTSPVGIVILIIAALIAIGVLLYQNWDTVSAWLKSTWESIKTWAVNIFDSIKDFFIKWGPLILAILGGPIGLLVYAIVNNWDTIKTKTIEIFTNISNFFTGIWNSIATFLSSTWTTISTGAVNIFNGIKNFFITWGPLILAIITGPIGLIVLAVVSNWDTIKSTITTACNTISSFLTGIWNSISAAATTAWNAIKDFLLGIFNTIKNTVSTVFSGVGSFINNIWTNIKNNATTVWNGLLSFLSGIGSKIQNTFSGVGDFVSGIWDGLSDGFKNTINTLISGLNVFIRGINKVKFDIPSWVPVIGGKKFGLTIPEIPKLAKGGVATSEMVATIGERGAEAVMPLENNTGWMNVIADKVGMRLLSSLPRSGSGSQIIQVQIGSRLVREVLVDEANSATIQAGTTVVRI